MIRAAAAEALGGIGGTYKEVVPALVQALTKALKDHDRVMSMKAAGALVLTLGKVTDQIDRLIRQLGADSFQQRERAAQDLVRTGEPALEALHRALDDTDPEVAVRAQMCILEIEKDLHIAACLVALKDPRPEERVKAAQGLGEFCMDDRRAQKVLPALMEALQDREVKVQIEAMWGLPVFQPGVFRTVAQIIRNPRADPQLRYNAARKLSFLGPAAWEVVPDLLAVLRTEEQPMVRAGIVDALEKIGVTHKER